MGDTPSKEEDNKSSEFTNKLKNAMTAFLEEMESSDEESEETKVVNTQDINRIHNEIYTVMIKNLSHKVTKEHVGRLFSQCGDIKSYNILTNRRTRKPNGIVYINYYNLNSVENAVRMYNNQALIDRIISVKSKELYFIAVLTFNNSQELKAHLFEFYKDCGVIKYFQFHKSKRTSSFWLIGFTNHESAISALKDSEDNKMNVRAGVSLFISQLPRSLNLDDLILYYSKYKTFDEVFIPKNKKTGALLSIAYVNFTSESEAQKALIETESTGIKGKILKIVLSEDNPCYLVNNNNNNNKLAKKIVSEPSPPIPPLTSFPPSPQKQKQKPRNQHQLSHSYSNPPHIPSPSNDQSNDKICVICLENRKEYAVLPCGHLCLCKTCVIKYKQKRIKVCPVCREVINNFLQIYD